MIGCASDNTQLAALIEDPHCEYRWIFGHDDDLIVERDFKVESMRIDDEDIPITETKKTKRGYEVWCGSEDLKEKINCEVKIEIEIVTKKAKSNKVFPVYLLYPTRGLEINFNYENTNFKNVREESFFAGRHPQPFISADKGKFIDIKISDEEWIFPTSGVIFVWDI
jgi:alanine racemase